MKTSKTFYKLTMSYCGGYLGTSAYYDKYSEAKTSFNEAIKDADNTEVALVEITISGFFKKTVTRIELDYCENRG